MRSTDLDPIWRHPTPFEPFKLLSMSMPLFQPLPAFPRNSLRRSLAPGTHRFRFERTVHPCGSLQPFLDTLARAIQLVNIFSASSSPALPFDEPFFSIGRPSRSALSPRWPSSKHLLAHPHPRITLCIHSALHRPVPSFIVH